VAGGMDTSITDRLKELEDENRRLKKMYAEERLKAEIIQGLFFIHASHLRSENANSRKLKVIIKINWI
jgi:hypothetical protein